MEKMSSGITITSILAIFHDQIQQPASKSVPAPQRLPLLQPTVYFFHYHSHAFPLISRAADHLALFLTNSCISKLHN